MWNLPAPGIEPVSPALAGGFLTTALTAQAGFTSLETWTDPIFKNFS